MLVYFIKKFVATVKPGYVLTGELMKKKFNIYSRLISDYSTGREPGEYIFPLEIIR